MPVEALTEKPEKFILNLMAKTIHPITVHDFPDQCTELLPDLMGQISFNDNLGQVF